MKLRIPIVLVVLIAVQLAASLCEAQIVRRLGSLRALIREQREAAATEAVEEPELADPREEPPANPPAVVGPRGRVILGLRARAQAAREAERQRLAAQSREADLGASSVTAERPIAQAQHLNPTMARDGVATASAELGAADTANLAYETQLSAFLYWQDRLATDLAGLTTVESWQSFLVVAEPAAEPSTISPDSLSQARARFDHVAGNPQFRQISSLPSFRRCHMLLQDLASESEGPLLVGHDAPNQTAANPVESESEILPVPTPEKSRLDDSRGERSILLRE